MTKRKDPEERKEHMTIRLRKKLINRLRNIDNYSVKIEKLIEENIDRLENEKES